MREMDVGGYEDPCIQHVSRDLNPNEPSTLCNEHRSKFSTQRERDWGESHDRKRSLIYNQQ